MRVSNFIITDYNFIFCLSSIRIWCEIHLKTTADQNLIQVDTEQKSTKTWKIPCYKDRLPKNISQID